MSSTANCMRSDSRTSSCSASWFLGKAAHLHRKLHRFGLHSPQCSVWDFPASLAQETIQIGLTFTTVQCVGFSGVTRTGNYTDWTYIHHSAVCVIFRRHSHRKLNRLGLHSPQCSVWDFPASLAQETTQIWLTFTTVQCV